MIKELRISAVPSWNKMIQINKEAHCVVDLFFRELGVFNCKRYKKIVIKIHKDTPNRKVQLLGDVVLVNLKCNLNNYFELENSNKKKWILDILFTGLKELNKVVLLDMSQIDFVYNKCKLNDCENKFLLGNIQYSTCGKYKGKIEAEHGLQEFIIRAKIYNDDDELLNEQIILTSEPYDLEYSKIIGFTKTDGKSFIFVTKTKKIKIKYKE